MTELINFKLKSPHDILPFGDDENQTLHWFGLTDSHFWFDLGKTKLYEYSKDFLIEHKSIQSNYVDYYLARLIEDFTEILQYVSEELPDDLYVRVKNQRDLINLWNESRSLLEQEADDTNIDKQIEYHKSAYDWIEQREITAGHLIGGPKISFFRNKDKISIVWTADYTDENKVSMWSAKNGQLEMPYSDFVNQIELFGTKFFSEMDNQINIAVSKNWETIQIDKKGLVDENQQRKVDFYNKMKYLTDNNIYNTDWTLIRNLFPPK